MVAVSDEILKQMAKDRNTLLRYFLFEHLRPNLRPISVMFAQLAGEVAAILPPGSETTTALRKLLEAKDCAVRAALDLPPEGTQNENTFGQHRIG